MVQDWLLDEFWGTWEPVQEVNTEYSFLARAASSSDYWGNCRLLGLQ